MNSPPLATLLGKQPAEGGEDRRAVSELSSRRNSSGQAHPDPAARRKLNTHRLQKEKPLEMPIARSAHLKSYVGALNVSVARGGLCTDR